VKGAVRRRQPVAVISAREATAKRLANGYISPLAYLHMPGRRRRPKN